MKPSILSLWLLVFTALILPASTSVFAGKLGGMDRAEAEAWWAFQPLPVVEPNPSPATIDAFIDRGLLEAKLTPGRPADPRSLIRRVHYGLTGLPPNAALVDEYVADPSPDAFKAIVNHLLASPEYGVHGGRRWLDVVRYADTAGENTDRPTPHAWRYRNWVIESFNRDLPYDEFVRMQLAGDLISEDVHDRDGVIATGYLAIARRFGHDIDQDIHLMYEDVIDNLGKTFLGLTVSCARCHDHKYDPITAEDYYALYGIFSSTRFSYSGCEKDGKPRDLVPLLSQPEVDAMMKPWDERQAEIDAAKKNNQDKTNAAKTRVKQLSGASTRVLVQAQVDEGQSANFSQADPVTVRKGEVIQLTVLPNGSHGADSTLIEWAIDTKSVHWNIAHLLDTFTQSNPRSVADGARWFFIEPTETGPVLLTDSLDEIDGRKELKKWSIGDLPSVFVNSSPEPIKVWTTLPARTVFVHPAPNRPVAVAWVSPIDGEVTLRGRVADAHPSGGDGVSFRLEHFTASEMGPALSELAVAATPLPGNGPRPEVPLAYAVKEAEPNNARVHLRGEPKDLGDEVPRAWLSVLGGMKLPDGSGSGRRELSEWIVEHPLTARVMVNRIWQGHFGEGLVRTENDFGSRGERPTHPELLDWLAAQFVASGYSVKAMHRLLLGSAAYQRSSAPAHAAAPGNHLLARFSLRRLTAEELRDSVLHVSGNLDRSPGAAHPFPSEDTWKYTQHDPFVGVYESNKRSAYLMVQRQRKHPFLSLFDGADPNASTAGRAVTTVPTQALYFLNDPFFHAQAARVGERVVAQPESERLAFMCRLLFQRNANLADLEQAERFLAAYPGDARIKWSAYARVLLASNEFLHVD